MKRVGRARPGRDREECTREGGREGERERAKRRPEHGVVCRPAFPLSLSLSLEELKSGV